MTIAIECADYHTIQSNVRALRRKAAHTNSLVLVIGVRTFRRAAGEAAGGLAQWGDKEEVCSCRFVFRSFGVVVVAAQWVLRFGCGWLAGLVVVGVGHGVTLSEIVGFPLPRTPRGR